MSCSLEGGFWTFDVVFFEVKFRRMDTHDD